MKKRSKSNGRFIASGGCASEKRDKPCPDCGKLIMRKSSHCRSCWQKGVRGGGYSAIHKWLVKYYKKPTKCEFCGSNIKVSWANNQNNGVYTRNPNDYLALCHTCHMSYDAFRRKSGKQTQTQQTI